MMQRFAHSFSIALESITQNGLRSLLTSLGIVFGVASVISMLAIGRGAQQEILDQMKILGANNIIIKPVIEQEEGKVGEDEEQAAEKKRYSPGLTLNDATSIEEFVPHVVNVSPEVVLEMLALRGGFKRTGKLVGVTPLYFTNAEFAPAAGRLFSEHHMQSSSPVCVIGSGIKAKFFPKESPLGKQIKCGKLWLTVIGVLKEQKISKSNIKHLGIRDYNMDIYTPISTLLLRFKNRAMVTRQDIQQSSRGRRGSNSEQEEESEEESKNYHQIDRLVVRVADSDYSKAVADVVSRKLERRHNNVVDFEIIVPELLLEQEQRTRDMLNLVLLTIAAISLVVGGIGIMNIMLASVMERIREIGVRLAVGARQRDIILQFLSEAIAISVTGGIVGIILGITLSYAIESATDIVTIIAPIYVIVSFAVSLVVGLVFGIVPARKAALQDPVVSLRYE